MQTKTKKLVTLASIVAGLLLTLIILSIIKPLSVTLADNITNTISKWWIFIIGTINSIFPFSVFELLVVLAIIALIIFIILQIKQIVKRNFLGLFKSLLLLAIIALSVANVYTLTTGFTYYRSPISIPQTTKKYDNSMVIDAATFFLNDYNNLAQNLQRDSIGNVISPYTTKQLWKKIANEYDKFNSDYIFDYSPRVKPILNSWFMTLTNITGITFVPLGEPNINKDIPPTEIPQVMAHELSHTKGIMREGDANFISFYILLASKDDYLRYCGYFSCFGSILTAVDNGEKSQENYKKLRSEISPLIISEQRNSNIFWSSKSSRNDFIGVATRTLNKISEFFNDVYLKLNGLKNGVGSYDDSVTDGDIIDTGETNPDTGDIIYEVVRSSLQKTYLYLYEISLAQ